MKIIHVGLGNFGLWWCNVIHERMTKCKDITLVAIVDQNIVTHDKVKLLDVPCYTDLAEAIRFHAPDFILNATPPQAHMVVNRIAFSFDVPVLMEKPISEDYQEVLECLRFAREGQKLAVAENYRYILQNIFVKEQLQKHLKNINAINLTFRRRHQMAEENYHIHMAQPLAVDITTHHIDLLRFFTDTEVKTVIAHAYTPNWSWYKGVSNMKAIGTMAQNIHFAYDASMDAYAETSWFGEWTFTAENGVARYANETLIINTAAEEVVLTIPTDNEINDKHRLLDDFMTYVKTDVSPPTHINDQAKNAAVVEAMIQSALLNKTVTL